MRRPASATHAMTLNPLSKEALALSPQRVLSFHSGLPLMYVFIKLFHMIGLIFLGGQMHIAISPYKKKTQCLVHMIRWAFK